VHVQAHGIAKTEYFFVDQYRKQGKEKGRLDKLQQAA
jgi:hypothetical protein